VLKVLVDHYFQAWQWKTDNIHDTMMPGMVILTACSSEFLMG